MFGEKEKYKNLEILEVDIIKQAEMKEKKIEKRRTRKHLQTKVSSRNVIIWINTCAVPLIKYSDPSLNRQGKNLDKWKKG